MIGDEICNYTENHKVSESMTKCAVYSTGETPKGRGDSIAEGTRPSLIENVIKREAEPGEFLLHSSPPSVTECHGPCI